MTRWLLFITTILCSPAWANVDLVKVDKSKRRMYLIDNNEIVKEFRIALGAQPKGHKMQEGDQRTPEGRYYLDFVLDDSEFYRSIHISYPNKSDLAYADKRNLNPGGNIKIHGLKNGERRPAKYIQSFDWTDGCIAISNQEMDELLQLVKVGTPIEIRW
ncbi:L,D-transpeptidase family protein [Vibrio sp. RE86]|uniref:L,D-transpeptidase family protein n=1 Tax=Vibrio sp. RE86 TaxID=2607605 RepID=UPI00149352C2|nr:L,D-transpeptidase family protein [Vibrio sp. RE86]NOH78859.1 L,D-transpeptidase family protein [Vibrio sp. RE86]